jgi:hypothetical protein
MNTAEFDELAGRLEGISRAFVALAWMVEKETCMDGLTLTNQWRADQRPMQTPQEAAAQRTLNQLAQALDAQRARHQQAVAEWRASHDQ